MLFFSKVDNGEENEEQFNVNGNASLFKFNFFMNSFDLFDGIYGFDLFDGSHNIDGLIVIILWWVSKNT